MKWVLIPKRSRLSKPDASSDESRKEQWPRKHQSNLLSCSPSAKQTGSGLVHLNVAYLQKVVLKNAMNTPFKHSKSHTAVVLRK